MGATNSIYLTLWVGMVDAMPACWTLLLPLTFVVRQLREKECVSLSPNVAGGESLTLCHPINTSAQINEAHSSHFALKGNVISSSVTLPNGNRSAIKDAEVKEAGRSPSPNDSRNRNDDESDATAWSLWLLG